MDWIAFVRLVLPLVLQVIVETERLFPNAHGTEKQDVATAAVLGQLGAFGLAPAHGTDNSLAFGDVVRDMIDASVSAANKGTPLLKGRA